MKVRAYAKVNLALDVVRKREDGYHDLEMIMAPITLHDLIYINVIDEGIEIESNSKIVPTDQRNIMYKVAQLMQERYGLFMKKQLLLKVLVKNYNLLMNLLKLIYYL